MLLLPSHRLVEKTSNPSIENISLSRAQFHGWGEGQGDVDGRCVSGVLIVVVQQNPPVAQVHAGCQSTPALRVPAVPSLLRITISTGRFWPRAVIVCWEQKRVVVGMKRGGGRVSSWLGLDTGLSFLCADVRRLHLSEQPAG